MISTIFTTSQKERHPFNLLCLEEIQTDTCNLAKIYLPDFSLLAICLTLSVICVHAD